MLQEQIRQAQEAAAEQATQRAREIQLGQIRKLQESISALDQATRQNLDAMDRRHRQQLQEITRRVYDDIEQSQRKMQERINSQLEDMHIEKPCMSSDVLPTGYSNHQQSDANHCQ